MKKFLSLGLVLCLVLCLLAGCGGSETADTDGDKNVITVEDFCGMTEEEIKANAEFAELYNFEYVYEFNSEYEEGKVCLQLPVAGDSFNTKPNVTLTISLGIKQEFVPELIGLTLDEGREKLTKLGFPIVVYRTAHDTAPVGNIYSVEPKAGTRQGTDVAVTIYVSDGLEPSEFVYLPNLIGVDLAEAERIISDKSLVVGNIFEEHTDKVPAGQVVLTTPEEGDVPIGSPIDLIISLGPIV